MPLPVPATASINTDATSGTHLDPARKSGVVEMEPALARPGMARTEIVT
jgi:hypothetical protein